MGLFNRSHDAGDEISFADLQAAIQAKACALVDVREPPEYASGHVEGAQNLPLSGFDPAALPNGKPVVLICRSGGRSAAALAKARAAGRADISHYRGGVMGWAQAGGKLV